MDMQEIFSVIFKLSFVGLFIHIRTTYRKNMTKYEIG